jgi:oligopeptide/dipeptide ABC transporter ATP-binding protein
MNKQAHPDLYLDKSNKSPAQAKVQKRPKSLSKMLFETMLKNPVAVTAGSFLLIIVILSVLAPIIAPYKYDVLDLPNALSLPTEKHLLGTDQLGRDILSFLLYGGVNAIFGVLEGISVAAVIAIPIGIIAGYKGGFFDRMVSSVIDAVLAIPAIIFILLILTIFSGNPHAAMIGFGVLVSPGFTRVIRGVTLPLRDTDYVNAARVAGVSDLMIMIRHILPGVTRTAIVQASFIAGNALMAVVALGFLGLTSNPDQPDWGQMVSAASRLMSKQPWLLIPPGVLISLCVLALILFGNSLRDASSQVLHAEMEEDPGLTKGFEPGYHEPQEESSDAGDKNALLSIRNLTICVPNHSRQTILVDLVSFDIHQGETVGLVGESGAGKSITSLAILGLLPKGVKLQSGKIYFDKREISGLAERDLISIRGSGLAYVSQEPLSSLDPCFKVGDLLGEVVKIHERANSSQIKKRCIELLRQVQLDDPDRVLCCYPHELSGGMAQRIAIAMALAGRPKLMIADEPTTALDVTVQKEILWLLRHIQKETGMSVMIVTHNLGVIADICDQVIVMYAGHIFETADVYQIFERPLNPYTQGLLKANPSKSTKGQPLPVIPGRLPTPGSWPAGCRFAPRCPYATESCQEQPIHLAEIDKGRFSRCSRVRELIERGIF